MDYGIPEDILDKYAYINVEGSDWDEPPVEEFTRRLLERGLARPADLEYDLAYRQCSFTTYVTDWKKFFVWLGVPDADLLLMSASGPRSQWGAEIRNGDWLLYYVPDNEDYRDKDAFMRRFAPYSDLLRCEAYYAALAKVDFDALRARIRDTATMLHSELLELLDAEYEYLTSPEAVAETICSNELWTPEEK